MIEIDKAARSVVQNRVCSYCGKESAFSGDYCPYCGHKQMIVRNENIDRGIIETLKISSYSRRVLAAYEAMRLAYDACESQYGKDNYKDYIKLLIKRDCPIEYEKAEVGRRYRRWVRLQFSMPWFFFIFVPFIISLKKKHKRLCKQK